MLFSVEQLCLLNQLSLSDNERTAEGLTAYIKKMIPNQTEDFVIDLLKDIVLLANQNEVDQYWQKRDRGIGTVIDDDDEE